MKKKIILSISFVAIFVLGFFTSTVITNNTQKKSGYSPNPNYEYLVGAAAWQMSGEAHALMMQGFNIAKSNIEDMILEANFNFFSREGYHWSLTDGEKKLCYEGKPVAIVCDIDDTLVDTLVNSLNCQFVSSLCISANAGLQSSIKLLQDSLQSSLVCLVLLVSDLGRNDILLRGLNVGHCYTSRYIFLLVHCPIIAELFHKINTFFKIFPNIFRIF